MTIPSETADCPHCGENTYGSGTHCSHCHKHRGLSLDEAVKEWPPLTEEQLDRVAALLKTGR